MLEPLARDRVIVAIDCGRDRAIELADELKGHARWLKVGMILYYAEGPSIVREFKERGFKVFLDLKFYDIPHQVRGAARSAALAGADLMSVHGMGSGAMLAACREGAEEAAEVTGSRPQLVAITVLTSMSQDSLTEIGIDSPIPVEADRLARLARENGIDGGGWRGWTRRHARCAPSRRRPGRSDARRHSFLGIQSWFQPYRRRSSHHRCRKSRRCV